jgi:hypothetical protein
MLGNDTFGDCTLAAVVHQRMANALEHDEPDTYPTSDQVVGQYLQMTGGEDTGLVEADVLHTWHTGGLWDNRIAGYAPINHHDLTELRSVVALFGACYLGVAIPEPAQEQFAAHQAWDLTGTPADREIEGGHAVPMVGYNVRQAYVVTWGRLQTVSWRWLAMYLEEGWAVLTSEDAAVNMEMLQADLQKLQ